MFPVRRWLAPKKTSPVPVSISLSETGLDFLSRHCERADKGANDLIGSCRGSLCTHICAIHSKCVWDSWDYRQPTTQFISQLFCRQLWCNKWPITGSLSRKGIRCTFSLELTLANKHASLCCSTNHKINRALGSQVSSVPVSTVSDDSRQTFFFIIMIIQPADFLSTFPASAAGSHSFSPSFSPPVLYRWQFHLVQHTLSVSESFEWHKKEAQKKGQKGKSLFVELADIQSQQVISSKWTYLSSFWWSAKL